MSKNPMAHYDSQTLQKLADGMRRQSKLALLGGVVSGIIFGGLLGYAATLIFYSPTPWVFPGVIVGALVGVMIGRQRALTLRLQSELALCLIEIEKHSRPKSDPKTPGP